MFAVNGNISQLSYFHQKRTASEETVRSFYSCSGSGEGVAVGTAVGTAVGDVHLGASSANNRICVSVLATPVPSIPQFT